MTRPEIREDLVAGSELGARRAKASPLSEAEIDHLLDIFASESKFSAVDMGDEVCLSFDGSGNLDSAPARTSSTVTRATAARTCSSCSPSTTPTRRSRPS